MGFHGRGRAQLLLRFYDEDKARGFDGRDAWHEVFLECRDRLGRLLNVPAETVSFASSTTEAVNLVANAVRLRPGDQVLMADDEFPSLVYAWQGAVRSGGELVRVPIRTETGRTDTLIAAIGPQTRFVCVSHVHWCTGTRVNLQRLGDACRAQGARLIVDGVQAVGAVPVDASVADFYATSTFKWLLSGFGLAVMITRADFEQTLDPLRARLQQRAAVAAAAALAHQLSRVVCAERESGISRLARLGQSLQPRRRAHAPPAYRTHGGWHGPSLPLLRRAPESFPSRTRSAVECAALLAQKSVRVEERAGLVRASPHFL